MVVISIRRLESLPLRARTRQRSSISDTRTLQALSEQTGVRCSIRQSYIANRSSLADGTCVTTPCWNYVDGIAAGQSIILDLYNETSTSFSALSFSALINLLHVASNISFVNFSVSTNNESNPDVLCDASALAPGEQNTLGFNCTDGPYVTTDIK